MLHDENEYAEPDKFEPERFLKDGVINSTVRDPSTLAFGFGRRICPGRFMAKESMWLAIACVLATMNISKAIGEDGTHIVPEEDYICLGMLSYPKPFPCQISPRSKEHERLILSVENESKLIGIPAIGSCSKFALVFGTRVGE